MPIPPTKIDSEMYCFSVGRPGAWSDIYTVSAIASTEMLFLQVISQAMKMGNSESQPAF